MADDLDLDLGVAGASARREAERHRTKREETTRERHPHIGGLLLRLQEPPASERAWATGAAGEEALGASLQRRCPDAFVLNDRRIPGSRANIDHIAVAPSGVYVIDTKRYRGKIEVRKPLFRDPMLFIRGSDKTKLVEGLERQQEVVRSALSGVAPQVPVRACFCFINPQGQSSGTDLPLFRTLQIKDYPLLLPRKLVKRLNQQGELGPQQRRLIAEALLERFPAA